MDQTPRILSFYLGKRVLITAGPTHEPIDPVRYIANRSSGRQGFAIAQAAAELGAEVTLVAGPVHLVACLKTVSESQAMRQLGFPDATIVAAPFGVYVADKVQKIQMVFLANCRDATTTRHALTRLVEWLDSTGEEANLVSRARGRRRIVAAVRLALDEGA